MCQALAIWPRRKYESQGGPGSLQVADLIHRTSVEPDADSQRFAQALVFNWLTCSTDGHARNYSLMLNGDDVRLAPLYDLNSHLAYSDGTGNNLSMGVTNKYRASQISPDDWIRFAPALHVDPDWMRAEIGRQADGLMEKMNSAAESEDIAAHQSPVIARLLNNAEAWCQRVTTQ